MSSREGHRVRYRVELIVARGCANARDPQRHRQGAQPAVGRGGGGRERGARAAGAGRLRGEPSFENVQLARPGRRSRPSFC